MKNHPTLIFAYRAENGAFNAVAHTLHRVFSPGTYECRLCYLITTPIGMLRPFKNYLDTRYEEKAFYHRKEFQSAFPEFDDELPLVLLQESDSNKPHILLDRADIESCSNVSELIEKLGNPAHTFTTPVH